MQKNILAMGTAMACTTVQTRMLHMEVDMGTHSTREHSMEQGHMEVIQACTQGTAVTLCSPGWRPCPGDPMAPCLVPME